MPDATAAAEPPLDPPALCATFHGLRVGPKSRGSVGPRQRDHRSSAPASSSSARRTRRRWGSRARRTWARTMPAR